MRGKPTTYTGPAKPIPTDRQTLREHNPLEYWTTGNWWSRVILLVFFVFVLGMDVYVWRF